MKLDPIKPGIANLQRSGPTEKFERPSPVRLDAQTPNLESSSLSAEFTKADLQDPAKVNAMIPRALQEVLQSELELPGLETPEQKAIALNWMAEDPTFRSLALQYLNDVLK